MLREKGWVATEVTKLNDQNEPFNLPGHSSQNEPSSNCIKKRFFFVVFREIRKITTIT
jgi:hypothetical protein